MTTTIRTRLAQIALKVESTGGADAIAGTPVAADYVTCRAAIRVTQDQSPNPVDNGAYDDAAPIPGGLRAEITLTVPLVGSGAAGTAPEWGRLLRACRMLETVTAAAIGTPTAATTGTTTAVTLPTATFGSTAQSRRGMPILLTGNPAAGATDVILDYTAGGVATLSRTYGAALSNATLAQIPAHVLYSPISDESQEVSLTAYAYVDGLRHRILGCKGSWGVGLRAGQPASLAVRLVGIVAAYNEATALPAGYAPVTRQAPRWAGGLAQLDRAAMQCSAAGFDMNVRTAFPDDPEAAQGYAAPIITGAGARISLDPLKTTVATPLRASSFRAGTPVPVACILGSTAGNRFAISCPSAQIVDLQDSERQELGVDALALQPDTANASIFLASF